MPVLSRNSVLACLVDCAAAVPFGRNLRTITLARSHSFFTRRYKALKKQHLFEETTSIY